MELQILHKMSRKEDIDFELEAFLLYENNGEEYSPPADFRPIIDEIFSYELAYHEASHLVFDCLLEKLDLMCTQQV